MESTRLPRHDDAPDFDVPGAPRLIGGIAARNLAREELSPDAANVLPCPQEMIAGRQRGALQG